MMDALMTGGFEMIIYIALLALLGVCAYFAARSVADWRRSRRAPLLTVAADVVSRRAGSGHYVTFQVESGDRMEFRVPGGEDGILAEGDCGRLTFQGNRYLSFERL